MPLFQRAVRGVRVRDYRPGACGWFADIVVDFEPAPEFEFVVRVDAEVLYPEHAQAVGEGIRRALAGEPWSTFTSEEPLPVSGPDALAVRAVLVGGRSHEIDSNEMVSQWAGWMAVRNALSLL
jgi:hypothetical protein